MEFAAVVWMRRAPSFWEGYGKKLPEDDESVLRMRIYEMIFSLGFAYICLVEYSDREFSEHELDNFRRCLSEISASL